MQAEQVVRPSTDTVSERARRKLERDLGELLTRALADPRTVEVVLNPDGQIWHERLGEPMQPIGSLPRARAQAVIETVAGYRGQVVTADSPLLEAELPDGSRFAGQIPPIVSAPTFSIRKPASALYSLEQYVQDQILAPQQRSALVQAVAERRNILVVGGTGSGKTTLVNGILAEIVSCSPQDRFVVIEDTVELQCAARNHVRLRTTENVGMTSLVRHSLRMRPDRIVVGEVRGPEALDLLIAWNTGHEGGVATVHANSAQGALDRMQLLLSMSPHAPKPIEPLIAQSVDVVVHIARRGTGRKVLEVAAVRGWTAGSYDFARLA